jgi:hypothetical protein
VNVPLNPKTDEGRRLAARAASADASSRLGVLRFLREQMTSGERPPYYFDLARSLIGDPDNDCRWQAMIVIGEFIADNPEGVWDVICEFGVSEDDDMRAAVSTILLEHLLEHDFARYFPSVKERVESGARLLADTLRNCWIFGVEPVPEVEHLLSRFRTGALDQT